MKENIMQRIGVILNALNSINVNGKANLANLSGSIAMLEEVAGLINDADVAEKDTDAGEKNESDTDK